MPQNIGSCPGEIPKWADLTNEQPTIIRIRNDTGGDIAVKTKTMADVNILEESKNHKRQFQNARFSVLWFDFCLKL